jgi:glucose/arabinose dehydrogenase
MLASATASAATLVPLAPPGSFASEPVFATSPPGDPRVFVVEREGGVRIVEDGVLQPTPFLTVPNVDTFNERGLLSIAFSPDYATSGLFYVFTVAAGPDELDPTGEAGQIRIVEYRRSADPDLADADSARLVLATAHSAGNHNGGQIMFGPEGLLHITIGDNTEGSNAQTSGNYFGKVLRIDPRDPPGEATFSVPDSNPFVSIKSGRLPLYAIGLRNPYRASFGPNGELVVADVGAGSWEEVDVGRPIGTPLATTLGGANLGWPECEGFCPSPPPQPGLTDPVFEYPHNGLSEETTGCAVLGGYVVRDQRLTGLTGRYIYGDLCRTDLRTLNLGVPGGDPQPAGISIPSGELRGFGEDSRGCVYVMTTETVYRVAPAPDAGTVCPPPPPPSPTADRAPPHLKLKGGRQKLRRYVTVVATCDEACELRAAGSLRISKPRRRASSSRLACDPKACSPPGLSVVRLRAGSPGTSVRMRLKMRKRVFKHAKSARRSGRKVRASVEVAATDASGNTTAKKTSIVLR